MKSQGDKLKIVLIALLLAAAPGARASLIAYSFSGHITSTADPGGTLPASIVAGAEFHGVLAYSTDVIDTTPHPQFGDYRYDQPLTNAALSITIGTVNFSVYPTEPLFAATQDVPPGDSAPDMFRISTFVQPPVGDEEYSPIQFEFGDYESRTALTNDALPLSLTQTNWTSRIFFILGDGGSQAIHGEIENLTAIPEPRTAILVAFGILVIGTSIRRTMNRPTSAFTLRFDRCGQNDGEA